MTDITREEVEAHDIPDEMVKAAAEEMMGHVNAPTGAIYKAARLALAAALRAFAKSMDAEPAVSEISWDDAVILARKAIHDDGRGMIGRNRNYLESRVARMLVHHDRETLSRLRNAASPQPKPTERVSG